MDIWRVLQGTVQTRCHGHMARASRQGTDEMPWPYGACFKARYRQDDMLLGKVQTRWHGPCHRRDGMDIQMTDEAVGCGRVHFLKLF